MVLREDVKSGGVVGNGCGSLSAMARGLGRPVGRRPRLGRELEPSRRARAGANPAPKAVCCFGAWLEGPVARRRHAVAYLAEVHGPGRRAPASAALSCCRGLALGGGRRGRSGDPPAARCDPRPLGPPASAPWSWRPPSAASALVVELRQAPADWDSVQGARRELEPASWRTWRTGCRWSAAGSKSGSTGRRTPWNGSTRWRMRS